MRSAPDRPLRVAIVNRTAGGLSGGYRTYLAALVPRLRAHPGIAALEVFVPPALAGRVDLGGAVPRSWPAGDPLREGGAVRAAVAAVRPDVVFVPTARWMDAGGTPVVVMVRNMEPLVVPFAGNSWREGAKNLLRAAVARRSCARAQRVIAVSGFVREHVVARWGIDAAKVGVVPHGVDANAVAQVPPKSLAGVLDGPWLFTAGSVRPARGLADAIHAAAALRDAGRPVPLVVAGAATPDARRHEAALRELVRALRLEPLVRWAGALSPAEMAWGYAHCSAFVMTSRVEACPNTALEALSHGALCVAADNPPLPEFFRDSAWYYPPGNAGELARRIAQALDTPPAQAETVRARARARAADFTWDATADRTVEELRRCVAATPPPAEAAARAIA